MRTPEEIKKALECSAAQADGRCEEYAACVCCPLFVEDVGLEDITACIQQLEAQGPKWISVEERLPDDLEEVLILVKETEFYGQYKELSKSYFCQYIGCVDDGEWFTVWCHGHRYIKDTAKEPCADKLEVTHWMPLPEPPKEG